MKFFLPLLIICLYGITPVSVKSQSAIPKIEIKTLGGATVQFHSIIDSSGIVVVCFWATWCAPCINELDAFHDKLHKYTSEQPFKILAIATDESRTIQKVKPFVKSKGWPFEIYTDSSNELIRGLNISNIPHLLLFDKGRLVYQKSGYLPGDEDVLMGKIQLLKTALNK
jgi:peroxiredoxin